MEVAKLTYEDLASQAGPLPAYDLGVVVDSSMSTVG